MKIYWFVICLRFKHLFDSIGDQTLLNYVLHILAALLKNGGVWSCLHCNPMSLPIRHCYAACASGWPWTANLILTRALSAHTSPAPLRQTLSGAPRAHSILDYLISAKSPSYDSNFAPKFYVIFTSVLHQTLCCVHEDLRT